MGEFEEAVNYVQNAPSNSSLTNNDKLMFYGLYKQSTVGSCTTKKPSRFQLVASAKWNAWNGLGKMTKEKAKKKYVQALNKLVPDWKKPKAKL